MKTKDSRSVDLHFLREQLLQDAANAAYVAGDVMVPANEHQRHQVQDIVQDGNVERVSRVLNLAVSAIREVLFPFAKNPVGERESRDDVLVEVPDYVIHMDVPPQFSSTTVTLLENLIHEFLVARILADWMSQTYPEAEAVWSRKADDALLAISRARNNRTRMTRRRLHPFG